MDLKATAAETRGEMLARERELQLLDDARREAAAGHGRIVLVAGEAGIGKSRLLREFSLRLSGGRAAVAPARCFEAIQTPLRPLRDVLHYFEHSRAAPQDAATRSLVERLTFERETDARNVQPNGWLFESIDTAFARIARHRTVTLLVEDVHWADTSTLDFLGFLAGRISARRMLVIATYRSDSVEADRTRMGGLAALLAVPSVSHMQLQAIDERAMHALVQSALPRHAATDEALVADIVRRSQGNPFFAGELVKVATEQSTARAHLQLPLSIRGAVLARAALLDEEQRRILTLAAVLGERFSIARLVAIGNVPRDDVLLALERARALHLVDDGQGDGNEMSFHHALTQEVFYGELLAERVRPIHRAIGLELEAEGDSNANCVELAYHWWRTGDTPRAAKYAELAGDRASAIGAFADAISYYERSLPLIGNGNASATLEHKIGVALGSLGRMTAGVERLRRASGLYWNAADYEGFIENASALGALLYNAGETASAIESYRGAAAELTGKLPAARLDLFRARMGYNCVAALDFDSALAFVDAIAEPISDATVATHAYQARFKVAAMRGDVTNWRECAERALSAARAIKDDGYRVYQAHCQIALDAIGLGESATAQRHLNAALLETHGSFSLRTLANAASAFEHALRGDFATAATLLAKAEPPSEQTYALLVHIKVAQLVLAFATGADARASDDEAESLLRYGVDHGMKLTVGLLGGPYAWRLGSRGDVDDAAALVRRIARTITEPHRFLFAFLAAARFGRPADVATMRAALAVAAQRPHARVNVALLHLFDAFAAQRGLAIEDRRENALAAAAKFAEIGWPWLAALSLETAGEQKRALAAYREIGAVRDLRRLEAGRSAKGTAVLSRREREVAELVTQGLSNDEIAVRLHISSRTVEKHVSAALEKLNVRSRVQLGMLLGASGRAESRDV